MKIFTEEQIIIPNEKIKKIVDTLNALKINEILLIEESDWPYKNTTPQLYFNKKILNINNFLFPIRKIPKVGWYIKKIKI